ncbi:MAG: hypothetical protein LC620_03415, partial [Halobacteriales archaeon]|nr:hypothetical protein [Halobacteriales archaeon]
MTETTRDSAAQERTFLHANRIRPSAAQAALLRQGKLPPERFHAEPGLRGPTMYLYELSRKENLGEANFPLQGYHVKMTISLDMGQVEVPPKARRHLAAWVLQELAESLDEEELVAANAPGYTVQTETPSASELALRRTDGWIQPDGLDLRIVKSAHRIILEVAERGVSGRVVLASELVGASGLSAPTIGRLLREGEPANDYL